MLQFPAKSVLDAIDHPDIVTACGLTRQQIFALPLTEKMPEHQTSTEVALRVYPTSLVGALRWLELHTIKPVGRQFVGTHPGLLWPNNEVSAHADNAVRECPVCRVAARHGLRDVASGKDRVAKAQSAA